MPPDLTLRKSELREFLKDAASEGIDEARENGGLVTIDEVERIVDERLEGYDEKQHPSDQTEGDAADNPSEAYAPDQEDEEVDKDYTPEELESALPDDLWDLVSRHLTEPEGSAEVEDEEMAEPMMENLRTDDNEGRYPIDLDELESALPSDLFEQVQEQLEDEGDDEYLERMLASGLAGETVEPAPSGGAFEKDEDIPEADFELPENLQE